jgi:Flp pilus assembly pilin Flp
MRAIARQLKARLQALHEDDTGANMVEYILMIAAVSLPLLGVLIWFWKDLSKWWNSIWQDTKDGQPGTDPADLD